MWWCTFKKHSVIQKFSEDYMRCEAAFKRTCYILFNATSFDQMSRACLSYTTNWTGIQPESKDCWIWLIHAQNQVIIAQCLSSISSTTYNGALKLAVVSLGCHKKHSSERDIKDSVVGYHDSRQEKYHLGPAVFCHASRAQHPKKATLTGLF